jgi:hypothetical protein
MCGICEIEKESESWFLHSGEISVRNGKSYHQRCVPQVIASSDANEVRYAQVRVFVFHGAIIITM